MIATPSKILVENILYLNCLFGKCDSDETGIYYTRKVRWEGIYNRLMLSYDLDDPYITRNGQGTRVVV